MSRINSWQNKFSHAQVVEATKLSLQKGNVTIYGGSRQTIFTRRNRISQINKSIFRTGIYCKFGYAKEGQVYNPKSIDVAISKGNYQYNPEAETIMGIDFGYANPSVYTVIQLNDGISSVFKTVLQLFKLVYYFHANVYRIILDWNSKATSLAKNSLVC